jgi:superfamily II DNA or RNA helicase
MSLEEWQVALRRQYGPEQSFKMKKVGEEPIFSEYEITNPQTKRTYQVAIRGSALGENYCSCPDFSVNTLGTCKHIEFALAKLGRKSGVKKTLAAGFHPAHSEIYLQYGARRDVVFRPGTECPESLKRSARRYFGSNGLLKPEAFSRFHHFLKGAQASKHGVRCYDDALAFVAQVRDTELLAERVSRFLPSGTRSAAFRKLVNASLYPYQRSGALFAAKAGRCLIADDMGLGKTIQAIAATEVLARTMGVERVLVISPTSLKHQWKREIQRFTDREALVVEGLLARRQALYQADCFYKITNYDVVFRDLESIQQWEPELIILDEAQRIKNWKTRTADSVKQLASDYAFVLTGTPLENRLEELYSIVQFVDRHRLGPMFRFLAEHQHVDETGRVIGYRNLGKIKKTLEPILVRRTKQEVLPDLPERMDKQFFVPMTTEQWKHHEENKEIVARLVAKWKRYGYLSETDQQRLMIALQNMRMACNSTYLLDKKTDHGVKADEVVELLAEILEDRDSKVVIFSQWVRMHELLVRRLKDRSLDHVMFYGGVPGPKRKKLVHRFQEDPDCRLFLSTDAGGVGLNLQNASVVINLDQPWNPAVLEQRIGRVHRLGQHRPVRVVHFIAQGTIEEGMLELLGFKSAMFSGVLDGGKEEIFLGKTRLKRFMETVEKATGGIPERMPTQPEPVTDGEKREPGRTRRAKPEPAETAAPSQDQLWTDVMTAGARFLDNLSSAFSGGQGGQTAARGQSPALPASLLARDEATGQSYLKLPVPEPEVMQKVVDAVSVVMKALRSS